MLKPEQYFHFTLKFHSDDFCHVCFLATVIHYTQHSEAVTIIKKNPNPLKLTQPTSKIQDAEVHPDTILGLAHTV